MKALKMLALVLAVSLFGASVASASEYTLGPITIDHPWARASIGANGAAFMMISTSQSIPDKLIGASSPVAEKVELHTHIMDGDVMRMRPVDAIDLSVSKPAKLEPGGYHIMLIGLKQPLKDGETFPLKLTFANAGSVTVDVEVVALDDPQPMKMNMDAPKK